MKPMIEIKPCDLPLGLTPAWHQFSSDIIIPTDQKTMKVLISNIRLCLKASLWNWDFKKYIQKSTAQIQPASIPNHN